MVQTTARVDDATLSVNLTVVIESGDGKEGLTEEEYAEEIAGERVQEEFGYHRGTMTVAVTQDRSFDSKNVYTAVVTCTNGY